MLGVIEGIMPSASALDLNVPLPQPVSTVPLRLQVRTPWPSHSAQLQLCGALCADVSRAAACACRVVHSVLRHCHMSCAWCAVPCTTPCPHPLWIQSLIRVPSGCPLDALWMPSGSPLDPLWIGSLRAPPPLQHSRGAEYAVLNKSSSAALARRESGMASFFNKACEYVFGW